MTRHADGEFAELLIANNDAYIYIYIYMTNSTFISLVTGLIYIIFSFTSLCKDYFIFLFKFIFKINIFYWSVVLMLY